MQLKILCAIDVCQVGADIAPGRTHTRARATTTAYCLLQSPAKYCKLSIRSVRTTRHPACQRNERRLYFSWFDCCSEPLGKKGFLQPPVCAHGGGWKAGGGRKGSVQKSKHQTWASRRVVRSIPVFRPARVRGSVLWTSSYTDQWVMRGGRGKGTRVDEDEGEMVGKNTQAFQYDDVDCKSLMEWW